MTVRAEKEPAHLEEGIEFIPLKEFPGLTKTIEFVDEATCRRLEGEEIKAPKLTPRDVKIVSEEDFFRLQRELLFPNSGLHKDARYHYELLDRAYEGKLPLIPEAGFLIDPETKKIFISLSHIEEVRRISKDKGSFCLYYGSLMCYENFRRAIPLQVSEEPLLALFGLESFSKYVLKVADFIQKENPKEAKKLRSQIEKLKERFDNILSEAQWGKVRIQIEGAKIAVFLRGKLLLRAGFWVDRQIAEIVSHKIRLTFAQLVSRDKKVAEKYVDLFEAKRKYIGQEFGLSLEETRKHLREAGLGTGAKLFEAYLGGEIPLVFAPKFYKHPEFYI